MIAAVMVLATVLIIVHVIQDGLEEVALYQCVLGYAAAMVTAPLLIRASANPAGAVHPVAIKPTAAT